MLIEKLTGSQLVEKFPTFCGTWRFITSFTSTCNLSLSWASLIQSIPPNFTLWKSIWTLSSHLSLDLSGSLFPLGFPTKILHMPLFSHIHSACPDYLKLLILITQTILGEHYRSLSSLLYSLLHSPLSSSLLGPNTLLNTLFSNTLSLRSSLSVSDQVSHPYRTTGNIILFSVACCVIIPLETLHPRRSEWGSGLPRIVLSPEEASRLVNIY